MNLKKLKECYKDFSDDDLIELIENKKGFWTLLSINEAKFILNYRNKVKK